MSQNVAELIVQIERDAESNKLELPSLPDIVIMIRKAACHPETGISEVARIIQGDPILTTRFLKITNSPLYRSTLPFANVDQVIQSLGLDTTQNIIISLILHKIFNVLSIHLHSRIQNLWLHSCRVATISQLMASGSVGLQPDRAMLAGLLHDIGVLPILLYADKFCRDENDVGKLDEIITQLRGSLGQKIIQHWQFDDDINIIPVEIDDMQRNHDGEADYCDLVQVAHVHSLSGMSDRQLIPPLSRMPAFNKLAIAKMGPRAGYELIEQARGDINATIRILNG